MDPTAFVYSFLLLVALHRVAEWYAPYHDLSEKGCVLGYVYDGDTIELKCGTESVTARLQGFDTPETKEPGCAAEAALGARATNRLRELVKSGPLSLDSHGYDKYGRVLATMAVKGRDVADILVDEGLAVRYRGGARVDWCERLDG
ncbi:thermonuclease family protein [Roseovarius sp. 2305UL8-3]|uniref:thermonuclease family protein n=1 Tax=Roseovarius conchicola TaxID=3121636 RepID=UPI003526E527